MKKMKNSKRTSKKGVSIGRLLAAEQEDSKNVVKLPITLRLPWAPSANVIWRNLKNGAVYLSPQYRTFISDSYYAYLSQGKPKVARGELLQVTLKLFPPHRIAYDIDNRIKPTLDALTKIGFWQDDRYVRKISVIANEPVEGGAIIVEIDQFDNIQEEHASQALLSWHGLKKLASSKKAKVGVTPTD